MWHHLSKAHHHIARHSKNFLVAVAERHPILTTALTLAGGALVVTKLTSSNAPTTNVPAVKVPPAGA